MVALSSLGRVQFACDTERMIWGRITMDAPPDIYMCTMGTEKIEVFGVLTIFPLFFSSFPPIFRARCNVTGATRFE